MALTPDIKLAANLADLKIIDVSDQPVKSNVLRQGKQVPTVTLDPKVISSFITPDVILPPQQAPRVVSQSIAPGIKVAKGATIDIVLAPRNIIPIDVIAGAHKGFVGRDMGGVIDTFLAKPEILNAVLDFDTAAEVPSATRTAIEKELTDNNISIVADDNTQNFDAAFRTLKGAAAFK